MLISWLKETRLKKSLSMRDLAELINQPHSFVGKIETLERRLDVYVIYCEALQVNPTVGLRYLSGK
jgi:transcriptional regulator with XRE-family HTH domain